MSLAKAEEGCPANQFPSDLDHDCAAVSEYDHLRTGNEPMTFVGRQISMHIAWVAAEGVITKDTPATFAKFLKSYDGKITDVIEFHSPGGNLAAALELGRMIRRAGYKTRIGRTISLKGTMNVYFYKKAFCLSACAYAFIGGVARSYGTNDVYGLHRFGLEKGAVAGDVAQSVTSEIAKYLEDMGVDQGALEVASSANFKTEMRFVPVELAKKLRIIFDPNQPYPFVIEDVKGVTVASTRLFLHNRFYNARVYCVTGLGPTLIVSAPKSAFPAALLGLKDTLASFSGNGEPLYGLLNSESLSDGLSYLQFIIPKLQPRHFLGNGFSLKQVANKSLPPLPTKINPDNRKQMDSLMKRIAWADAVTAISFTMRSDNAERTLPIILRNCHQ